MAKIRGFKPDIWTDEDFVEVSPFARLLWMGMWNYCCDNGHIQDKSKQIKMRVLPTDDVNCADLLRELASQGLIVRDEGWITVPNLTKHQKPDKRYWQTCEKPGCVRPGKDSQPETRSAPHETTTGARSGLDVGSMGTRGDGDGDGDGELMVITTSRELALAEAPRSDVEQICEHLASRIAANGSKRPTITKRWLDAARLMLDNDKRTEGDVHAAIDWCQGDEFWRANIQSLPKLREKFDQMRLQAQRGPRTSTRQQETDDMFDRAMQRAIAKEAAQ
jgi:hypothetical protein